MKAKNIQEENPLDKTTRKKDLQIMRQELIIKANEIEKLLNMKIEVKFCEIK